ncbi:MAG: hypothetical protein K1X88_22650, partial [Nannocystaceae bacterium]|nr:hypothetical protein [Nannocystaceae bacterium]
APAPALAAPSESAAPIRAAATPPRGSAAARPGPAGARSDGGRSTPRTQNPAALDGEAAMLREANRALTAGDADAALAQLRRHAQRYPDGVLAQDREALRVLATCAKGRADEAARLRDGFLKRWPTSVHAARVRAACGETSTP